MTIHGRDIFGSNQFRVAETRVRLFLSRFMVIRTGSIKTGPTLDANGPTVSDYTWTRRPIDHSREWHLRRCGAIGSRLNVESGEHAVLARRKSWDISADPTYIRIADEPVSGRLVYAMAETELDSVHILYFQKSWLAACILYLVYSHHCCSNCDIANTRPR
jgi:hypothetical protein